MAALGSTFTAHFGKVRVMPKLGMCIGAPLQEFGNLPTTSTRNTVQRYQGKRMVNVGGLSCFSLCLMCFSLSVCTCVCKRMRSCVPHTHTRHTHTHTRTQGHTHTHTYTHTQAHAHTGTRTHRHKHTQAQTHTDTHTLTHMRSARPGRKILQS